MPSEIAFLHGVRDRVPSEIAFPLLTATVYVHSTVNKPSQYNWIVHGAVNVLSHIHDSNSIREQAHNALLRISCARAIKFNAGSTKKPWIGTGAKLRHLVCPQVLIT